MKKLKYL